MLIILQDLLNIHSVHVLSFIRKQPSGNLSRLLDETVVVYLREKEHVSNLQPQSHGSQLIGEISDAPGEFAKLLLGEQTRLDL